MLYHLLYPFHTELSVLNVTRYITFRTAIASLTALAISLLRSVDDPKTPRGTDRSGHPSGRAGNAPAKGWYADDGWVVNSHCSTHADITLG